jgi:hypothetical protein
MSLYLNKHKEEEGEFITIGIKLRILGESMGIAQTVKAEDFYEAVERLKELEATSLVPEGLELK